MIEQHATAIVNTTKIPRLNVDDVASFTTSHLALISPVRLSV